MFSLTGLKFLKSSMHNTGDSVMDSTRAPARENA